jgi:hypothetical protein
MWPADYAAMHSVQAWKQQWHCLKGGDPQLLQPARGTCRTLHHERFSVHLTVPAGAPAGYTASPANAAAGFSGSRNSFSLADDISAMLLLLLSWPGVNG